MRSGLVTVILFFNKPAMTIRCAQSVQRSVAVAGEILADHRLILLDNGSSESASATVASAIPQAELVSVDPRIRSNAGFARGMNAGLRAAFSHPNTSRVLALCNDVELPEEFHATLARLPRGRSITCPHVHFLMDRSKPSYTHGTMNVGEGALTHSFAAKLDEIKFPNYYPAAAMVWDRYAFDALGGFDERYFCYWEDVELSHRASKQAVALKSEPALKIFHLGRGTTGGKRRYDGHFADGRRLTLEIARKNGY